MIAFTTSLLARVIVCDSRHVYNNRLRSGRPSLSLKQRRIDTTNEHQQCVKRSVVHALSHVLFWTINYCGLNNYQPKVFVSLIFIAVQAYENILTPKFSRFTVQTSGNMFSPAMQSDPSNARRDTISYIKREVNCTDNVDNMLLQTQQCTVSLKYPTHCQLWGKGVV